MQERMYLSIWPGKWAKSVPSIMGLERAGRQIETGCKQKKRWQKASQMDALKHKSCSGHQRHTCASGDPEPDGHQGAFLAWKRLDETSGSRDGACI